MNLSHARQLMLLHVAVFAACSGHSDRHEWRYETPPVSSSLAPGCPASAGGRNNAGAPPLSASGEASGGGKSSGGAGTGSETGDQPGVATNEAGASESGGAAGEVAAGASGGATMAGGPAGGVAGSESPGGASMGGSTEASCTLPADCPLPPNRCVVATCAMGSCRYDARPPGAVYLPNIPADCHATTACDGQGHPVLVVDQSNVPTPANPCLAGTCNAVGTSGTQPLASRTPCAAAGGVMCDGAGQCVECLLSVDCPNGKSCSRQHQCVTEGCTDVDCGGPCPFCPLGKKCLVDADCQSGACDAISLTCIADHCADHRLDAGESDVDCGGTFPCARCTLGQRCNIQYDCDNFSCDALSRVCVADHCTDHAPDADETDLDCGGPNACARCSKNKLCKDASDCQDGLSCVARYCQ